MEMIWMEDGIDEREREREGETRRRRGREGQRQIARRQRDFLKGGCNASAILFRETAPVSSALRGGFGLDWGCAWGQRPQLGWLPPTCHPVHLLLPSLLLLLLLGAVPLPPPTPHSSTLYTLPWRTRCTPGHVAVGEGWGRLGLA